MKMLFKTLQKTPLMMRCVIVDSPQLASMTRRAYSLQTTDLSLDPSNHEKSAKKQDPDEPIEMEDPYLKATSKCTLCGVDVNYKNAQLLSQFMSSFTGMILPKDNLNLCDEKYDQVCKAIKTAQVAGFLPYLMKEPIFFDDPYLGGKQRRRETQ